MLSTSEEYRSGDRRVKKKKKKKGGASRAPGRSKRRLHAELTLSPFLVTSPFTSPIPTSQRYGQSPPSLDPLPEVDEGGGLREPRQLAEAEQLISARAAHWCRPLRTPWRRIPRSGKALRLQQQGPDLSLSPPQTPLPLHAAPKHQHPRFHLELGVRDFPFKHEAGGKGEGEEKCDAMSSQRSLRL